jgi:hypothetical protein
VAAGETPATHPEKFEVIPVPGFLADFAAHGAYTDWLRGEGQQGKALAEARDPWDWLYDELDEIEGRQGQVRRWRVIKN